LNLSASGSCLEIEDHGLGFDPRPTLNRPGHLGLIEMSERAREIGWRLSVESQPGQGTRIRVLENQPEGVASGSLLVRGARLPGTQAPGSAGEGPE
jgi:two-component system nitrate/nitrite sensor histidine kinase NarX